MSDLPEEVAQALVVQGLGEVNYHYEPASFSFVGGDVEKSLYIIPIVELDGKLLVALPAEAWDRIVARRLVPRSYSGQSHQSCLWFARLLQTGRSLWQKRTLSYGWDFWTKTLCPS